MSSISLSIKYRPVRIGFLIPEGSIDDLVKAAELNCLLWGGIYNPRGSLDKYWRFIRSGIFAKENNQEGAIPVIVGLLTLNRVLDSSQIIYSTTLNLKSSFKCEIDFSIVHNNYGEFTFGIAECKSAGQKITLKEINNLKNVQDTIKNLGIDHS